MRVRSGRMIAVAAMLAAAGVVALLLLQGRRIREEWYLRRLLSEDAAQREEAANRLAGLGVVRAIPPLIDGLRGQTGMSLRSREPASLVRALEDLVRPEAIPFLEEASRDADLEVRSWALAGLSRIRHGGLDALIRLAADGEPARRVEAIKEIRRLGPDGAPAVDALEMALRARDPGVRLAAVVALGELGAALRKLLEGTHASAVPGQAPAPAVPGTFRGLGGPPASD
jgi:HEAT repeat protein